MPSSSLRHLIADSAVLEPGALRALAGWYREYAECTGNPVVWHARLATAELLDREAARLQERVNGCRYAASADGTAARGAGTEPGE